MSSVGAHCPMKLLTAFVFLLPESWSPKDATIEAIDAHSHTSEGSFEVCASSVRATGPSRCSLAVESNSLSEPKLCSSFLSRDSMDHLRNGLVATENRDREDRALQSPCQCEGPHAPLSEVLRVDRLIRAASSPGRPPGGAVLPAMPRATGTS